MKFFNLNLRGRIYVSMLALILLSLFVIGITTIIFFNTQNKEYHEKRLQRKEKTVITSLKILFQELDLNQKMDFFQKDFDDKIHELSVVNNIEINVFNLNGEILMSSNFEYSDTTFYKTKIADPILKKLKSSGERQVEKINENYFNTYTYVQNETTKENIVIINIPYNTDLSPEKNELSSFLTTLLEVYIFLLIGASLIAYFLSNYITKSLRVIAEKLKLVKINAVNESIEWKGNDEIGTLINEYNSMISQLEESALKLAKSERESAWREMAKQVAHEIKNPLTPMRLSIQHLERSLDPNSTNFKEELSNFSKKLIQQIDTLTSIANEFSRFAQMPKLQVKQVDIKDIIDSTIELYRDVESIQFKLKTEFEHAFIEGDKDQLIRVFNNLVNNAIQAISDDKNGEIHIQLSKKESFYLVAVKDNGSGMTDEVKEKVFQPNFTTKSTGAGLGLAMVKQIIDSHHGKISFVSSHREGTTFFIEFPIFNK